MAQLGTAEIEFLWRQLEDSVRRGKNKDSKTKLERLERIYHLLDKTIPKKSRAKKR